MLCKFSFGSRENVELRLVVVLVVVLYSTSLIGLADLYPLFMFVRQNVFLVSALLTQKLFMDFIISAVCYIKTSFKFER